MALTFSIRDGNTKALDETWGCAFGSWKDNIKYMVELTIVTNHLCWETYSLANGSKESPYLKASKWFEDKYQILMDYIFDDKSGFSEEDRNIAFDILD